MRVPRLLTTSALVIIIGGCAAAVVSYAATQPKSPHDEPQLGALPTLTTTHATIVAGAAAPVSSSPRPGTRSRSVAPARTSSTPRPSRPAPRTTAKPAPKPKPQPRPASTPAPRHGQALPLGYRTGLASRVITVVAPSAGSTTALLQAWTKAPGGGWLRYGSAVTAHVGSQGLTTHPNENLSATPIGSFTLTQAFGALSNPGTGLPYFRTDSADWWVSDSSSRYYNTHHRCPAGSCPFDTGAGENLRGAGFVYNHAVVIDYNRFPVTRGAGSAFFLHVTNGAATAGCVAISQSTLVSLMRWLVPSTHPRILIGVA
jgi:L,D-peptidoglycan transpeptidase YkuD (ErfK/YbiS/YcfS/YnhG family)